MIEFEKSPKVARLADANDKVYLLLAHGRWFSLGTPFSSTTKTSRMIPESPSRRMTLVEQELTTLPEYLSHHHDECH
jgi:hypothetical protein